MPQAMEWSLATPITRPRLPFISLPSAIMTSPLLGLFRFETADKGSDRPMQVLCGALEHQRRVGAAKAEGIGQRRLDLGVVDALAHDVRVGDGGVDVLDIGALADEARLHHQQRV